MDNRTHSKKEIVGGIMHDPRENEALKELNKIVVNTDKHLFLRIDRFRCKIGARSYKTDVAVKQHHCLTV